MQSLPMPNISALRAPYGIVSHTARYPILADGFAGAELTFGLPIRVGATEDAFNATIFVSRIAVLLSEDRARFSVLGVDVEAAQAAVRVAITASPDARAAEPGAVADALTSLVDKHDASVAALGISGVTEARDRLRRRHLVGPAHGLFRSFGLWKVDSSSFSWRWMLGLAVVPAVAQLLLPVFLPESPCARA